MHAGYALYNFYAATVFLNCKQFKKYAGIYQMPANIKRNNPNIVCKHTY